MNFYDELLADKAEDKTFPEVTAPGLLNAIVKDIWDEEHQGMIKVEYLMGEKDKKTSDWVRVLTNDSMLEMDLEIIGYQRLGRKCL